MRIDSYVLKIIAILAMLVDHGTVAFDSLLTFEMYEMGRAIGRTAFPIFCFMIVEGYIHTGNRWKYLLRLGAFALISEGPFDLLFNNELLEFHYQNVFFTLAIGLAAIMLLGKAQEEAAKRLTPGGNAAKIILISLLNLVFQPVVILSAMFFAERLNTDYSSMGILLIIFIYYFEKIQVFTKGLREKLGENRLRFIFAGIAVALWFLLYDVKIGSVVESAGFPAIIFIVFYNGERGRYRLPKYFFYAFYPLHILLLYFLRKRLAGF